MYCSKCGAFIPEGAEICPGCNEQVNNQPTAVNNSSANSQSASGGVYYTPQQSRPEYTNVSGTYNEQAGSNQGSYYTNPDSNSTNGYYSAPQMNFEQEQIKNNLSTANTLGIIAIVLGILVSSIVGIICGAIGLSKANSVPDMPMNPLVAKEKAKVKNLNILGIVLPFAIRIALVILYIIVVAFAGMSLLSFLS